MNQLRLSYDSMGLPTQAQIRFLSLFRDESNHIAQCAAISSAEIISFRRRRLMKNNGRHVWKNEADKTCDDWRFYVSRLKHRMRVLLWVVGAKRGLKLQSPTVRFYRLEAHLCGIGLGKSFADHVVAEKSKDFHDKLPSC